MKEECVFLFLFQPFTFEAYFPALPLKGKKNQVAQLESEGPARWMSLSPGFVPPQVFCGSAGT